MTRSHDTISSPLGGPGGVPLWLRGDGPTPEQYRLELRRRLRRLLRGERPNHTWATNDLEHEVYADYIQSGQTITDPDHFMAWASAVARNKLVEYARRRNALKRGGGRDRVPLGDVEDGGGSGGESEIDLEALHRALNELARHDPRSARMVEMRFFGGMTMVAIAKVLGVSDRQLRFDMKTTQGWLHQRLKGRID